VRGHSVFFFLSLRA